MASKYPFPLFVIGAVLGFFPGFILGAHWWDTIGIYIISWLMIFGPLRKRFGFSFSHGVGSVKRQHPLAYGYLAAITVDAVMSLAETHNPADMNLGRFLLVTIGFFAILSVSFRTAESFFQELAKKKRREGK